MVACLALWLLGVKRLPAPVEELSDTPTPRPQAEAKEAARAKPVRTEPKPMVKHSVAPSPVQPPSFGGKWVGTISQGVAGTMTVTLTINPTGTSVIENSKGAAFTHRSTPVGSTLTWKAGWLNEITWTFTPNSDGATAAVTSTSSYGVNGSATFRRQ